MFKPRTKHEAAMAAEAIEKEHLVDGATYYGHCRNAEKAVWHEDKKQFSYMRNKFGNTYKEYINHFEDDDGYDVFFPLWRE